MSDSKQFKKKTEIELDEDMFMRPSHDEYDSLQKGSFSNFPDNEFNNFKKQKAELFIFNNLLKAYAEKQIAAFYNIWDNIEYMKIDGLRKFEISHLKKMFQILKKYQKPKKNLIKKVERFERVQVSLLKSTNFRPQRRKHGLMRKVREALEREDIKKQENIIKETKNIKIIVKTTRYEEQENIEYENEKVNPVVGHIFYLLSKRFKDSKYKTFFMDQIELLIYKYKIKNKEIKNILNNMDLRFDIKQLCHEETETENEGNNYDTYKHAQKQIEKQLKKKMTKENMNSLELMMQLFRADQFYAPLLKGFSRQLQNYKRNFFVNLFSFAKLAPFRKLHNAVTKKVKTNLKASFYKILFYDKPNMRLLLLIYVISKIKQKREIDAFHRIAFFFSKGYKRRDSMVSQQSFQDMVKNFTNTEDAFAEKIMSNQPFGNNTNNQNRADQYFQYYDSSLNASKGVRSENSDQKPPIASQFKKKGMFHEDSVKGKLIYIKSITIFI